MTTLRREQRTKIETILAKFTDKLTQAEIEAVAELIVDGLNAPNEDVAIAFRGDYRVFNESLWEYARVLRDTWMMVVPDKPKKKSEKGKYGFWCTSLEDLRSACGEFGADVLVKVRADWKAKFRDGIAPYTVSNPASLVKVCEAKAIELRQSGTQSQSGKRYETLGDRQ